MLNVNLLQCIAAAEVCYRPLTQLGSTVHAHIDSCVVLVACVFSEAECYVWD